MDWTLLGYYPKLRLTRSAWVSPFPDKPEWSFPVGPPVEEICSASNCIASGPRREWEADPFSPHGGYFSPAEAWAAVPAELRGRYDLFALRAAPWLFRDGKEEPLVVPYPPEAAPLPATFRRLGYDPACIESEGMGIGLCSPLSCNFMANELTGVNRCCLADTFEQAREWALSFSITQPEPGPYGVLEVWRQEAS